MQAMTLFEKIWNRHVVVPEGSGDDMPAVLYIDLHLIHEVTSPQAFTELKRRGRRVRRPDRTLATMDHSTPTLRRVDQGTLPILDASAARQLDALRSNCETHGITLLDLDSDRRGIVHVIGPELGLTQPGMTIVCGDSHTSTHGAFGALAFGIGTSEVAHVLATQCLLQRRPRTMSIRVDGLLGDCVTAKDVILTIIREIGSGGGVGHVIEYCGSTVKAMSMEQRMTVCNMSIEAGARAGMIAPDVTTMDYLRGRPHAPHGDDWERSVESWRCLHSDPGASFDREHDISGASIEPMITYGTNLSMSAPAGGCVPDRIDGDQIGALGYMGLEPGQPFETIPVDRVFIGSCTNGRISDLRMAAAVLRGRRIAGGVRVLVVPGSQAVKRRAEQEGLARIFVDAGAEWREPGCSMCIAMNGDRADAGEYVISTSNRNFEGRQGAGSRTLLASPLTAAAAAVAGRVIDPRDVMSSAQEVGHVA